MVVASETVSATVSALMIRLACPANLLIFLASPTGFEPVLPA